MKISWIRAQSLWALFPVFFSASFFPAFAEPLPAWFTAFGSGRAQLSCGAAGSRSARDFCKSEGINEVYVSVSVNSEASEENQFAHLVTLLHRSNIRVEALFSSVDADEPGSIETSFWIGSGKCCASIRSILPIASMAFTWI